MKSESIIQEKKYKVIRYGPLGYSGVVKRGMTYREAKDLADVKNFSACDYRFEVIEE